MATFNRLWQLQLHSKWIQALSNQVITTRTRSLSMSPYCYGKVLSVEQMNQNMIKMEYAVRGIIPMRAMELNKELKQGAKKPFNEVVFANIGDPQAMGQRPITFFRQVTACCNYPELIKMKVFPADVTERAVRLLADIGGGGLGSYSDSQGPLPLRKDISNFISIRDNYECDPNNVFLCAGATDGIKSVINLMNFGEGKSRTGILIPIPQYPLYSATLTEMNIMQIGYYLDEDKNWALDINELQNSIQEARKICSPRGLVIINPGNPTGQCLSKRNIEEIIRFCISENLIILADEVYQNNIYTEGMQFHSFRKVAYDLRLRPEDITIVSFHSASKGYMGECGYRAGYLEVLGLDPEVKKHFRKHRTANLCSSTTGQVLLNCVVNPPKPGEESYKSFAKERDDILKSLTYRAVRVSEAFNRIDGIKCNRIDGAMYAFPSIYLPKRAIEKAKSEKMPPDTFFCLQLLEETGICVVPGSGFGQRRGTYHFRMTILPSVEKMDWLLATFENFYNRFLDKYKNQ